MARYKIWDKIEPISTIGADQSGKSIWTAAEYINDKAQWAANPAVKVIVGAGPINGTHFMELTQTVDVYKRNGCPIVDGMTDAEILATIEEYENHPPEGPASADERTAAALEFMVLNSLPDA